uniref:Scol-BPFTx n=1 Tax=Scolopendra viridis TaxID=118503 RepID=A0A4D5R932_SCOVI
MLLHGSISLLVLVSSIYLSHAADDFIAKWRNDDAGPIEFQKGFQVGLGIQIHTARDENPARVAKCIEEKRSRDRASEESGILYIDKAFEFFGMCFCEVVLLARNKQNCRMATVDYTHNELQYRHYYRFHIHKSFGSVRYFEQQNLPEKKENIFIKTITNRSSKKLTSNAEITIVRTDGSSTTASSEIGGSLGASFDIKGGIVNFKGSLEQSYSYNRGMTNKSETKSTFTLNRAFDVPPNSAVQIICSLKNQAFDLKWEIPVTISGAVAIKMRYDRDVDDWMFIDVKFIARYFKEFSMTKDGKLRTFIRGRTQGNKHYSAEVNPQDMPLEVIPVSTDVCNPLPKAG